MLSNNVFDNILANLFENISARVWHIYFHIQEVVKS